MLESMPSLEKFLADISRLQTGFDLLERVYTEVGGYNKPHDPKRGMALSAELARDINRFFGFDDSE